MGKFDEKTDLPELLSLFKEWASGNLPPSENFDYTIQHFAEDLSHIKKGYYESKTRKVAGDRRLITETTDYLLEIMDLEIEKGSATHRKVLQEMERVSLEIWETAYRKVSKKMPGGEILVSVPGKTSPLSDVPTLKPKPILLEDLWEEYKEHMVGQGEWRKATADKDYSPRINALCSFVGNVLVNQITSEQMWEYRKLLGYLPPYYSRKKEYEDLSKVTPDDIKAKHKKTLDISTIGGYIHFAAGLFNFAVVKKYIEENPVSKHMIPPKKGDARTQRHPFDDPDDLPTYSKGL